MTRLTTLEFRICQILLSAARRGESFDVMCKQTRQERIPEECWRPLYEQLGLKVWINGKERYVYPPGNLLPFASRSVARCVWPAELRTGGSAA